MQGAQRYVLLAFLILGAVIWASITKLFAALAYATGLPDPALLGPSFTLGHLIGFAITAGGAYYVWKNEQARDFCFDVVSELQKTTWPSRKETQTATIVVIITTILCAIILGVFDFVWAQLTSIIYSSPTT